MKIVSFTYCNDVTNDGNGNPMIVGPLQMLMPINLPANYSFSISFGVYDITKNGNDEIEVGFYDRDNTQIALNRIIIPSLPKELSGANNPIGLQINVGFRNVILQNSNEHYAEIKINGNFLGKYPIDVVVNEDNGGI